MRTPSGLEEEFTLDYILNSRMEVIAVKSNNTTDRVHDRLRARGKVRRKLDSGYLEALRRSVRYWDGRAWRTTATMVNGTPAL